MPIKKLVPKVPDPYISKTDQAQFWPARFGHLDYIIDAINDGAAIPDGFTQTYTELITIPSMTYGPGPGPNPLYLPTNGLHGQLIAQGKFIIPLHFTLGIVQNVIPMVPFFLTSMQFGVEYGTGNTAITSQWSLTADPAGPVTMYVPAIVEAAGTLVPQVVPISGTQLFRLDYAPGGGGYFGDPSASLKIAFTFQAIDTAWFFRLTN